MQTVKIDEKLSFNIIPGRVIAIERVFKGIVRCHVLTKSEEIARELTLSRESWKEAIKKYDLVVYSGKS